MFFKTGTYMPRMLTTSPHLRSSRRFFAFIALLIAFCFLLPSAPSAEPAHQYQTEREAQQHCPNDTVVWLNTRTGVYHFKGQRWYGATKEGCYECRKEADREGDRATRNGQ
jgi:hypothetical protein